MFYCLPDYTIWARILQILVFIIAPIVLGSLIYYHLKNNNRFFYIILVLLIIEFAMGVLYGSDSINSNTFLSIITMIVVFTPTTLSLLGISYIVLRKFKKFEYNEFNQFKTEKILNEKILNVDESVGKLQKEFGKMINNLEFESNKIQVSLNAVIVEIENKNKKILTLLQREKELKHKIEQYKNIADLSKKKVDAVYNLLNKGKYKEYLIGFLLGFVSSLIVAILSSQMGI